MAPRRKSQSPADKKETCPLWAGEGRSGTWEACSFILLTTAQTNPRTDGQSPPICCISLSHWKMSSFHLEHSLRFPWQGELLSFFILLKMSWSWVNVQGWPIKITIVKFMGNGNIVGSLTSTGHISALWLPSFHCASDRLCSFHFAPVLTLFLLFLATHNPFCICKSRYPVFKVQLKFPLDGIISGPSPESALPLVSHVSEILGCTAEKPTQTGLNNKGNS